MADKSIWFITIPEMHHAAATFFATYYRLNKFMYQTA